MIDFEKYSMLMKLAAKQVEIHTVVKLSLDPKDSGVEIIGSFATEAEAQKAADWLTANRPINAKGGYVLMKNPIKQWKGESNA